MSDILIKNKKMPKNCDYCPFADMFAVCDCTSEGCPLVEVPTPHGRLIDADAVSLEGGPYEYDEWCKWALEQYLDAPTIIPAEGGT